MGRSFSELGRVLLCSAHPDLDRHDPGPGHPEGIGRLHAAVAGLVQGAPGEVRWLSSRAATGTELAVAHDPEYLDALRQLCEAGGAQIDPDTQVSPGSWETARLTAGGGLSAMEALAAGEGDAAFVLGRPPGHHATRDRGMGFCLINNVAVAAATLREAGERVAIVDWDVHHGNGTQEIFWEDPSVLYVSLHQWPLYPGTGRAGEKGGGAGLGTTINLPLAAGSTGRMYLRMLDEVVIPALRGFRPTWLLVSAGFDAHRDDPLGDMSLTAGDFADMTSRLLGLPCAGRVILFLEGGYDAGAVRDSVAACAARLAGSRAGEAQIRTPGTGGHSQ